jgi:hypothetical protein
MLSYATICLNLDSVNRLKREFGKERTVNYCMKYEFEKEAFACGLQEEKRKLV